MFEVLDPVVYILEICYCHVKSRNSSNKGWYTISFFPCIMQLKKIHISHLHFAFFPEYDIIIEFLEVALNLKFFTVH